MEKQNLEKKRKRKDVERKNNIGFTKFNGEKK